MIPGTLEYLVSCQRSGDERCLAMAVKLLLDRTSVAEALEEVSSLTPSQCHTIGHRIGRETYARTRSVERSLLECTATCSSSCIHGAIGAAFSNIPEVASIIPDVEHMNLDMLRTEGERLCTDWETCHGVGHVAFQLFNELNTALRFCELIAEGEERPSCYWGVYMENNTAVPQGVSAEYPDVEKIRDPADLLSPCSDMREPYIFSCFHFLYMNQEITFREEGVADPKAKLDRRMEACVPIDSPHLRRACYEGVGLSMFINQIAADTAHATCAALSEGEHAACLFGFEHARSDWGRADETLASCAAEGRALAKRACYEAAFESVRIRKWQPLADACTTAPLPEECGEFLDPYISDPHALVFSYEGPRE